MFTEIANLTQAAKLSGVTMNMRPAPDNQLYITVSFILPPVTAEKVWDSEDANAQRYIDLRSALSVPVVITAKPEDILSAIINKLSALSTPVVEAAKVYIETDISSILKAAVSNAPKADAKPVTPKDTAAKTQDESKTPTAQADVQAESDANDEADDEFEEFKSL